MFVTYQEWWHVRASQQTNGKNIAPSEDDDGKNPDLDDETGWLKQSWETKEPEKSSNSESRIPKSP